ncbi:MAG: hypothetical protein KF724_01770 [Phycisphaeraceae bacterium]|nr:hypothetical protein [Phycisphaeraceae bacterium]
MNRATAAMAIGALALVFLALTLPVLIELPANRSQAIDERLFHLPVIETFAAELPTPNLRDYRSATGPTYHLLLAIVHRASDGSLPLLRVVNLALGFCLVVVVWCGAARRMGPWLAVLATLPLVMSSYLLAGSLWLASDNLALALALAAVLIAIGGALTPWRSLGAGCALALAVSMRQLALWGAAPLALGSAMRALPARWRPTGLNQESDRWGWIGCLPPVLLLGSLALLWGGPVPPTFRSVHAAGVNGAAVPFALALMALLGAGLLPAALTGSTLRDLLRRRRSLLFALLPVVGLLSLLPATNYFLPPDEASAAFGAAVNPDAGTTGRYGGPLWAVVARTPAPGERSLILIALALVGSVIAVALFDRAWRQGRRREVLLLTSTMVAFIAVQTLNSQTFQRYFEPFMLTMVIWTVALGIGNSSTPDGVTHRRRALAGFTLLALIQLSLTLQSVTGHLFR